MARSGYLRLAPRRESQSDSDVDDDQFGRSGRLDAQWALADHARRIVRPQTLQVHVHIAVDHVEVAAVPRLELVPHRPAHGIEPYGRYFCPLGHHAPAPPRTF